MFVPGVLNFKALFALWFCWSLLLIGGETDNAMITHPAEVEALTAIKGSLVDPFQNLENWNHGDPCESQWSGVGCFNRTMHDGYLHVRELRVLNMNLSGSLAPEIGNLSYMQYLDVMWNNISGTIPKEIGKIMSLELLLLNGNQLVGSLPDELGYLPNLDRIQIDENHISGPLPRSFAYLNKTKHFHMNNNSLSGQIPPELSRLPNLVHMLLDNNNLSGYLPPELSQLPNLLILQLDNNKFEGNIPSSYSNMSQLLKLSLRNCSLQGTIPDLSGMPNLTFVDLSLNQLNGSIPQKKMAGGMTTINLSNNSLTGTIPSYFSDFPFLQRISVANNFLSGSVPSSLWQNRNLNRSERLILDFENNRLSNISGSLDIPPNVTVRLQGNPFCLNSNMVQFCGSHIDDDSEMLTRINASIICPPDACPLFYEYLPDHPGMCLCVAPLLVEYRLKSPGFSDFWPYMLMFQVYLTSGLDLQAYQLHLDSFVWQSGPRLRMFLKLFPPYVSNNSSRTFNDSEVLRIRGKFLRWLIPDAAIFGPYETLDFTLLGPYRDVIRPSSPSVISKGVLAGIIVGAVVGAVTLSAAVTLLILKLHTRKYHAVSKRPHSSKITIKIDGVKSFTYEELALATNNFSSSRQVGQGGYGKVYKGTLADGTEVAIKRAQQGSLQGEREFLTEIELLSRLHHRNLVSLVGYCDEETEQMLVYEFIPHGTLRDHLSGKFKESLNFAMRLRIAFGSAKGVLYLHTEADPPIFHRDIKASNILVDSKYNAKVADFGLSRLAPDPDMEGAVPAHVSTVVKGTPGYLDPEYFLTHKLTDKSDVYSLGVVFLELLTGMHPISHGKNIVREVNVAYQSGMTFSVIDEHMGSYPSECVEKFITLALKCCEEETDARPSMAEVVRELEKILSMMPESVNRTTDSMSTDPKNFDPSLSSSSATKNPYVSTDVSGSDLVSGVVPTITPR